VKKRRIWVFLLFAPGLASLISAAAQKTPLPDRYKKWLDEDVVYIIRPLEREVFLKLESDRERDLFIEAFWRQRDPTPNTPDNEYKTEHYRRIAYANKMFSRSAPRPGWRTDRGRIYILLGEPTDTQRLEGTSGNYPAEIWFYQNKAEEGLPGGFNIVFFQEGGVGDFRLYSPVEDGPQALMPAYSGDRVDYIAAYQKLLDIQPTLANVSLSLIPGEDAMSIGRPSLASDVLLQKVEDVARNLVQEKYAQKFLQYKDVIDVEYTANYLDSEALVKIAKDPSGLYFVHYAVEPKRLSVNAYGNKYSTVLRVNGTASTLDGKTIYQFEKTINLNLDEAQIKTADVQPFNLHDMFPLIPGTYKLSILVRNEANKEFTSLEQTLVIPGETPALQMTSPLLGFKASSADATKKRLKPFEFGSHQIYCQPNRVFTKKDTLVIAFQVFGLTPAQKAAGIVRYILSTGGRNVLTRSRGFRDCADLPNILEEIPLGDFTPAHYGLRVVLEADGRELLAGTEEFDVTYQEAVPRPWIYSRLMPESGDPVYDQIIGSQLFQAGKLPEAKVYLERSFRGKPDAVETAVALGQLYLALGEYDKIPTVLFGYLGPTRAPKYEVYWLVGQAHEKMGEFARAAEIYDQAVSHFGVNVNLLNALGECYAALGRTKDALTVWERSLGMSPNQPEIKKKVEALKEKKCPRA
jgi:GWxTD domain-containing protein